MSDLAPGVAEALTFQSYAPGPAIDGVQVVRLRKFRSLEGSFMEHLRLSDGRVEGLEPPFLVRQLSVSRAEPGRVNAFHLHPKRPQEELWCVLEGDLRVWLVDVRGASPTVQQKMSLHLSGEEPVLLRIPAGVAHGYRAGGAGALLLYAASDAFDLADPNEGRLPWDFFGAGLWADDRG